MNFIIGIRRLHLRSARRLHLRSAGADVWEEGLVTNRRLNTFEYCLRLTISRYAA
jgi:hypothetical protein